MAAVFHITATACWMAPILSLVILSSRHPIGELLVQITQPYLAPKAMALVAKALPLQQRGQPGAGMCWRRWTGCADEAVPHKPHRRPSALPCPSTGPDPWRAAAHIGSPTSACGSFCVGSSGARERSPRKPQERPRAWAPRRERQRGPCSRATRPRLSQVAFAHLPTPSSGSGPLRLAPIPAGYRCEPRNRPRSACSQTARARLSSATSLS